MRLIDKELLLQRLRERKRPNPHGKDIRYYYWLELYNYVYDAPTVDAVPVIRCKDCTFYDGMQCLGFGDGHLVGKEDYCSSAERKEE